MAAADSVNQRTEEELEWFEEAKEKIKEFLGKTVHEMYSRSTLDWENDLMHFYVRGTRRYLNVAPLDVSDCDDRVVRSVGGYSLDIVKFLIVEGSRRKRFALDFIIYIMSVMKEEFMFIECVLGKAMKELIEKELSKKFHVYKQAYGGDSYVVSNAPLM